MSTVGVGVVGLGFMGRTHVRAYRDAATAGFENRLVAVCDSDPERRSGSQGPRGNLEAAEGDGPLFDADEVRGYERFEDLLGDKAVELVSICTHTSTHVDLAVAALEAGKHVLVEKPIGLRAQDVARLRQAADAASGLCMPAMCMRFWPGWDWAAERIASREHGAVRSATFQRLAIPPAWSRGFYSDPKQSGGALLDLHIHDADFVVHCFGMPQAVTSTGTLDHITTLYHYDSGTHVVAEGGWDHHPSFAFRMRYIVNFERATAEFDLGAKDVLAVSSEGETHAVELAAHSGYDGEVRHLLETLHAGSRKLRADMAQAHDVARLLEAERESLEAGARVELP